MPIIKVSSTDLKQNELLEPAWYPATLLELKVEPNKEKSALNYIPVVELPGGKQIEHFGFSSKKPGMLEPVMIAVGIQVDRSKDYDLNTDDFAKKKIKVHIYNDTYQGRLSNKIDDWASADKDTSPAF